MPHQLRFVIIAGSALVLFCFVQLAGAQAVQPAKPAPAPMEERTLHFPPGKGLGMILVRNSWGEGPTLSRESPFRRQIAGAVGTVKIKIPKGSEVIFEANRRVFEKPELLEQIAPDGIDELKLGFISLADEEDGMCDRVLKYVPHFKNLQRLNVDRSETTDAGLNQLKDMPALTGISCFLSSVNGSCFKQLATLPSITEISMPRCQLDQRNLVYLSKMHRLNSLNVENGHIDELGMKYLSQCPELVFLTLRGNKKVDDQNLKYLLPLKKLQEIDLRGTAVTPGCVDTLKALKLKRISLPSSMAYKQAEIKSKFPAGTMIGFEVTGKALDHDNERIYAPLK